MSSVIEFSCVNTVENRVEIADIGPVYVGPLERKTGSQDKMGNGKSRSGLFSTCHPELV